MDTDSQRLLAIILITHSRAGPKLVFRYVGDHELASSSDAQDACLIGSTATTHGGPASGNRFADFKVGQNGTKSHPSRNGKRTLEEGVLGLTEETLEKLLSPGRWCDRKRFEVSFQDLTFVGHPVYADTEGSWTGKTREPTDDATRDERPNTPRNIDKGGSGQNANENEPDPPGITIVQPTPAKPAYDFKHVPESLDSRSGLSLGASMNSGSSASANVLPESLMAFHVVFAMMKSEAGEGHFRAMDLYEQVAKKLTKALTHCQKESSYVGIESRKLSQLEAKSRSEEWDKEALLLMMLERSDLARALKEIHKQISVGGIATFRIQGIMMSLQIKTKGVNDSTIGRHQTVLLLEDKDVLLRELSHPDTQSLAHFIREYTPTKSLQKQTVRIGMSIKNLLYLAQHLINWQKARAIQPLHPRNTYVVGREAPLDQMEYYAVDYAKRFAALPSLPQVLKVLSGKPVIYSMLIPSRDHRAPYTDILAYLVRHKFVEQLKTSGWLRAPPTKRRSTIGEIEANKNRQPLSVASLLSPQMRAIADDDLVSVSSERTAIPISLMDRSPRRSITSPETVNEESNALLVDDPLHPTDEKSLCLHYIADATEDSDLRDRLSSLYQYFDGEAALEDIAAQEGLKRSVVDAWLGWLQDRGFLLTFRHL